MSLFLSGGIDPIYTTDPKTRADVEPWVDVPYDRDSIVEAKGVLLGPHFSPLAPHASKMAILNGIQVRTANHHTGAEQFLRMKTGTKPGMPSLLQLLGERRDGQAVGCMSWLFNSTQIGQMIDDTTPDDLRRLGAVLRARSRELGRDGRSVMARGAHGTVGGASGASGASGAGEVDPGAVEFRETAESLGESAELIERIARIGPPSYENWTNDEAGQRLAISLQRISWILENDLTRCYELNIGGADQPWDTHTFNRERQASASTVMTMIARFLDELDRRKNAHGALSSRTLVILGSEIGRFPALNSQQGKDHFPEAPCVLLGAGIHADGGKGASYGRTGKDMASQRISRRTGRDTSVRGHQLVLDDVGTTLLHLGGIQDPSVYGYDGEILEFLVGV